MAARSDCILGGGVDPKYYYDMDIIKLSDPSFHKLSYPSLHGPLCLCALVDSRHAAYFTS